MTEWPAFIKEHFTKDVEFIRFMGIDVMEIAYGYAKISMCIEQIHANTYGMAHGGVCAALVDTASGICLRTLKHKIVTVETTTVYYAPASIGDTLYAIAKLVNQGRKLLHAEVEVKNQDDKRVAGGKTIYFIIGEDDGIYRQKSFTI